MLEQQLELPPAAIEALNTFRTGEFATFTKSGEFSVVPVIPFYDAEKQAVLTTTSVGIPQKAYNVRRNPHVSMLLSEPFCSSLTNPPAVLVQGIATVSEDLESKRLAKFGAIVRAKVPEQNYMANPISRSLMAWYFVRLVIDIIPHRVLIWPNGDFNSRPQILGPDFPSDYPQGVPSHSHTPLWDESWATMATRYHSAVITLADPDGFPFSYRCSPRFDSANRSITLERFAELPKFIENLPVGTEATLLFHRYGQSMKQSTMAQFQLRGTLNSDGYELNFTPFGFVPGFNSKKADSPVGLEKLTAGVAFIRSGKRKTKKYLAKRPFAPSETTESK